MSLPKQKFFSWHSKTPYQSWHIITFVLFGVLAGSVIVSTYFIYSYVYRTLDDAHSIVVLNSNASVNTVNLPALEKAKQILALKKIPVIFPPGLRNIFIYGNSPNSTTANKVAPTQKILKK